MNLASIYEYLYLLIVAVFSIFIISRYKTYGALNQYEHKDNESANILLVLFMIFFIGLRPVSYVFGDMGAYANYYELMYRGSAFVFDWNTNNLLFDNILAWWGANDFGVTSWFVAMSAIYFGAAYIGIRRLFPKHKFAAYLVFLAAFSTFTYGTNGIKAGVAGSLFLTALAYRQNLKVCIPLILISWGFHHSMQLLVTVFFLTLFFKDSKWFFLGWTFCLLMAVAHVSYFQNIFADLTDKDGAAYLIADSTSDDVYLSGFRLDFILYSAMPVLVGYFAKYKKKLQLSQHYTCLLNTYLCTNGIWMLCMYASYTNRIAYLSWLLYPVVLIYPFLNEDWGPSRYRTFSKVAMYHLCFTLFMQIVFYKLIK